MSESLAAAVAGLAVARTAVRVDDVHLTYTIYEDLSRPKLRYLFQRGMRRRVLKRIDALKGVSLEISEGQTLGLIGRNGSGKSTLLRVMGGLLSPTEGAVYVRSRPVLLGVSAALNPELSGRRNIYLGCTALGMSRKVVSNSADGILAYAGLEEFADIPLRAYSSGMRARLQFAIASRVEPDVLLIDEALGVGDEEFRKRSLQRIDELRAGAGAVVLVSHNLSTIAESCDRVIWLHGGLVQADGPADEVIATYREST